MASSTSISIYSQLDPSRKEIRLLVLHPSKNHTSLIHASLHLVSLDHRPYYEALSYCWGSTDNQQTILLSTQEVKVTANLHEALLRLREKNHLRILWVDAVCINQADNDERGSQVMMMDEIYKRCISCFIWLGESNNETNTAIRVLQDWATGVHLRDYNFSPAHITAAAELTSRAWFSRIWTVQESILPPRLDVICGEDTWSWSIFANSVKSLEKHLTSCCSMHNDTSNEHMLNINKFIQAVSVIEDSRDLYPRKRDPLACLHSFRIRDATNPSDKIYGLLSLIQLPYENFIKVSYGEPVEKVYTNTCKKFIEHSGSLEVFKYVLGGVYEPKKSEASQLPLPSWVPDWRIVTAEPRWQQGRLNRYSLYNASGSKTAGQYKPEFLEIAGKSVLRVRGVSCGTVVSVGEERQTDMGEVIPEDWYEIAKANCGGNIQVMRDAFFSTVLMDTFANLASGKVTPLKRATEFDYKEYKKWPALIVEGAWPQVNNRLYFSLETATLLRRFFVTIDGDFGMGPASMKLGDEIFVVEGGRCPLILRSNGLNDHYVLIGDCYLHKFMDGEAMTKFEEHLKSVCIE